MSFKKGQSGNLKGKPKGTISQKTIAWENLGNFIIETGAERVKTILTTAEPEDFIKYYTILLEYFKPKLGRLESKVESKVEGQLKVNVINPIDVDLINRL
jgi:hypothetical protein